MKGKSALMAGVAIVALVATAQVGFAAKNTSNGTSAPVAASGPTNAELSARVQALEDALQADETKSQGDHSRLSALEQNFNYTTWTFDNARPVVSSGDGRFSLALRVRFQADLANFLQDSAASLPSGASKDLGSGAVIRRGFFGVEGKAFNDFWYEFRLNGGGSNGGTSSAGSSAGAATGGEGDPLLSIARIAYTGIPHFRINVGVIEPAFMLEGTTSSGQLMFMERPEIDNIAADSFGAGDARRGVEVAYQYENLLLPGDNFVLTGAFTGNKTGSTAGHGTGTDEQTQALGRLSYRFWSDGISNAVLGASGASLINTNGSGTAIQLRDRPEIRVDGTRLIDTGSITAKHGSMYAFDASGNFENFYLGGEWANFEVDRSSGAGGHPDFSGWYVEGSWILTGETKSYTTNATNNEIGGWAGPKVANAFSLDGDSWGAWELVARYSDTDLDWRRNVSTGVAGGQEKIFNVGVNLYLNNVIRLGVYDEIVKVDKVASAGSSTKAGQDLNIVGVRLQFSN